MAHMFCGIITGTGTVVSLDAARRSAANGPLIRRLRIAAEDGFDSSAPGASVSVNGVCLTLVSRTADWAEFDVVVETLRRTNLGRLGPGDPVNLELALRPGDRIDGHFVQGHVDATGVLSRIERRGGEYKLWITADASALRYIIPKGSVALDGVSLTVVDAQPDRFSVVLIPTTLERTGFKVRREGDTLNIETDIISRTVVERLQQMEPGDDASLRRRLVDGGFIS